MSIDDDLILESDIEAWDLKNPVPIVPENIHCLCVRYLSNNGWTEFYVVISITKVTLA